eukprot:430506-Heterocapsa_arctica.AAC.1
MIWSSAHSSSQARRVACNSYLRCRGTKGTTQAQEDGLAGPKQVAVMRKFASESIERRCANRLMIATGCSMTI